MYIVNIDMVYSFSALITKYIYLSEWNAPFDKKNINLNLSRELIPPKEKTGNYALDY